MLLALIPASLAALVVSGLIGFAVAAVIFRKGAKAPEPEAPAPAPKSAPGAEPSTREQLENYQQILDTLDRSNVLLWWAHVWKEGEAYKWKIRTPPQLRRNSIYRLASLVDQDWLWKNEQAPDHERAEKTSSDALAQGANGYKQEFRIIGIDGIHWLSEEVIIRPAGVGEWNLVGVVIDATSRHEAEEARKLTEGQLDQILRGADCLLWHATVTEASDGEFDWQMFVAPSVLYQRIFGEDATPLKGQLWTEAMVTEWDGIQQTSRRALREGRPDYEQEYHITNGGNTFVLHEHVKVSKLGPRSWSLVGVCVDITARRDAEQALAAEKERLAVTLGSMSEGVVTIDSRGRVLFMNKAAGDMVQLRSEEAVGRDVTEICILKEAGDGNDVELPVMAVLEQGIQADLPPQTLIKGLSDRMRLVEGRLIPVANVSSKRVGAVLVLRDITERRRMEEKLQNAAKMESVGILAGGIAHDFNNILTAILSNLTLLQLDLSGVPDQASLLDEAVLATKRAGDLTLQLLTFAKGGDPVRSAVYLHEVIREAATFSNRGSGVKSEFEMPADLWAANVDKAQISQVIQNLVINATQAMHSGGTLRIVAANEHIFAGTHSVLPEGDYVRISVTDTGAGIPRMHIGKIFDPYFTTKLQGHGLGLATVFSIVKRHQGHIEVTSVVGTGTTFTFWLPAARASAAEAEASSTAPFALPPEGKGGRVLFMDDEEPILRMAEKLMKRMGLEYETVPDGATAVKRYAAAKEAGKPFDLVVMDLTIPGGMGGREAISVLRAYDPTVKAIVSSGYSSDLAMADFRKHGFRGMVAKPYDISELASVIRGVLAETD